MAINSYLTLFIDAKITRQIAGGKAERTKHSLGVVTLLHVTHCMKEIKWKSGISTIERFTSKISILSEISVKHLTFFLFSDPSIDASGIMCLGKRYRAVLLNVRRPKVNGFLTCL